MSGGVRHARDLAKPLLREKCALAIAARDMHHRLPMGPFLLRRFAAMAFVLWFVVTLTFFLVRLAPGGPFDRERKIPPTIEKQLLAKYKLDGPVLVQYRDYLADLLRGDLRISSKYRNRSVNEILAQTLPVSATLGGIAFLLAAFGGIALGTIAAAHQNTWADTGAMFLALLAISVPTFVTGPILILAFAIENRWLPVSGWGTPQHLILPAITLAGPYMAYVARLTRTSMLEVLSQDFIRTARAKGAPERSVLFRHALKAGILPVISFLGPLAANLLTGSVIVEAVFNIPGAGGFFVHSILNRDGFLLGGVVIVYCTLLVAMNLLADILYGVLDRRVTVHA